MARETRVWTALRTLLAATLLAGPAAAAPASPTEPLREVREVRIRAPRRPKLSRVLERIEKSRRQADEDAKTGKVSAAEWRKLRKDLSAISDKALALALKGGDLSEARAETLDWELDHIRREPSTKKPRAKEEHRALAATSRGPLCSAAGESYDCLPGRQ